MSIKRLCDAFEPIQRANTGEELRREMERFAKQMGFDRYVYALKITAPSLIPQEYLLSGYPEGWVNRYVSRGYFKIDPIVRQCEHSTLPVLWDEHMVAETDVSEFWEEAHSFGLRAGLSFTVREQPGVTGILSLSRDQSIDLEEPELAAIIGRAQVFASVLHYAVARIDLNRIRGVQKAGICCVACGAGDGSFGGAGGGESVDIFKIESGDFLFLAVFGEREVAFFQVADQIAMFIAGDDVDEDYFGVDADAGFLIGGLRGSLRWRRRLRRRGLLSAEIADEKNGEERGGR